MLCAAHNPTLGEIGLVSLRGLAQDRQGAGSTVGSVSGDRTIDVAEQRAPITSDTLLQVLEAPQKWWRRGSVGGNLV